LALSVIASVKADEIIDGGTTVTVPTDHASPWVVDDELVIGDTSTGTLVINPGASVNVTTFHAAYIGNNTGSNGTVNVIGGSFLPPFTLGVNGTGTINASAGAVIDSSSTIGGNFGSLGTLNLSGGSTWTNEPNLEVGANGTGIVNISGGSTATSEYAGVGDGVTSVGTINITGAGSNWTNSAFAYIGKSGTGALAISNGGSANLGQMSLGYYASGVGTITVDGTGSQLTTGGLSIGDGNASGDPACSLPGNGCTSSLTVTNNGVVSDSGSLIVGNGSAGALSISSGGVVSASNISVANTLNSSITVSGTGSQLNAGSLYLGGSGLGSLIISAGGSAVIGSGGVNTGYLAGNVITVTGAGSSLSSTGDLFIAGGTVTFSAGAVVSNVNAWVGYEADAIVNVTGAGTQWNNSGDINIGYYASGFVSQLNITNGATVTSVNGILAPYGDSETNAVVTVSGAGSSWTMSGDLTVGMAQGGTLPNDTGGTLTISNGGVVSDVNGIIASSSVATGTVTVTGANSAWNNSGNVTVGDAGTATLNVNNGGAVSAATMTIANQAGSIGTVNVGADALSPAAASGALNIGTIAFGAGTGTLVLNYTDLNYILTPDITGNGTIQVLSGTTHYAANGSAFTGTTSITNAILSVNGSLGGTTTIGTEGTLMGNGTMGNVIVANGGTIAPGNSIGTLHSTGTITFASGSTYNVQLNSAGQSDLITTTGAATINGGTVVVSNGNVFNNSHIYTILTAAGGVTGQFSALTTPFSRVFLTYDADDVYLKYIPALGVTTRNEIGAASGLQSLGMGAVYNAVTAISDANSANQALDQVSGEIHASAKTALIEDGKFLSEAVSERLRGSFGSQPTSTTGALSYADASNAETAQDQFPFRSLTPVEVDRPVGWGRVFGSQAKSDSDANAAALTYSTGGLLAGVDGSMEAWRVGFMTGYSKTSFNTDQRGSGSSSNYHLGVYGGRAWGPLAFRSMISMTLNDINTSRAVAIPGFSDNLKAQYYAETLQAFGELGYQVTEPQASTEPFVNVAYVGLHTQGFTEDGGTAALSAAAEMTNTGFSTLGIRQSFDLSGGPFDTIRGSIGWRHAYGDTIPISVNSFAGGGTFTVAGVPIAKDAAVVELGAAVNPIPGMSLSISYYGQIASSATNQGITAKFAAKF
jgi:outer membrane autotransporter protein